MQEDRLSAIALMSSKGAVGLCVVMVAEDLGATAYDPMMKKEPFPARSSRSLAGFHFLTTAIERGLLIWHRVHGSGFFKTSQ